MTEVFLYGIDTSRKSEKCYPCLRYKTSPISQVGHQACQVSSVNQGKVVDSIEPLCLVLVPIGTGSPRFGFRTGENLEALCPG